MAATVWKGHLSFGLVSIPVRLYKAARAEKIKFRQLYRPAPASGLQYEPSSPRLDEEEDLPSASALPPAPPARTNRVPQPIFEAPFQAAPQPEPQTVVPIRQTIVTAEGERPIPRSEIVRGYEYEPDRYVLMEEKEIRSITPKTSEDIQILEFVKLGEIDPVHFETSYYMAPEPAGEKPYALLYAALERTGYVALAQIAMHRREHVAVIRAGARGILLHTMFYANEVRKDQGYQANRELVAQR